MLLKLGPELKDCLAAESDPGRIETMLQDEVETALPLMRDLLRKLARRGEQLRKEVEGRPLVF